MDGGVNSDRSQTMTKESVTTTQDNQRPSSLFYSSKPMTQPNPTRANMSQVFECAPIDGAPSMTLTLQDETWTDGVHSFEPNGLGLPVTLDGSVLDGAIVEADGMVYKTFRDAYINALGSMLSEPQYAPGSNLPTAESLRLTIECARLHDTCPPWALTVEESINP